MQRLWEHVLLTDMFDNVVHDLGENDNALDVTREVIAITAKQIKGAREGAPSLGVRVDPPEPVRAILISELFQVRSSPSSSPHLFAD